MVDTKVLTLAIRPPDDILQEGVLGRYQTSPRWHLDTSSQLPDTLLYKYVNLDIPLVAEILTEFNPSFHFPHLITIYSTTLFVIPSGSCQVLTSVILGVIHVVEKQ